MTEQATATNPNEASATVETPATETAASTATTTTEASATEQTQTSETQAATTTETTEGAPKTEQATTTVVPEKYEFTAPEGTEYDPGILDAFSGAAKEANLSQDAAQKLLANMAPVIAARQAEQVKQVQEQWKEASTADPEIGGEKLQENLAVARKGLDTLDPIPKGQTTTALRTLLTSSGLGNHPEVLRLLFRAGQKVSEDGFVVGSSTNNANKTLAEKLYGG